MPTATHFEPANVSGAGIVFGVFAALVCHIMLSLLGLGLGLSTVNAATADAQAVQWGAFTLWAIAGIISAFVGGAVAGWMAGAVDGSPGFHGLATWAITTVIVVAAASYIATAGTAVGMMAGPSFGVSPREGLTPAQAEAVANAAGPMALASFVVLALGAFAAYFGAHMAAQRETRMYPHTAQRI
jgi:hypothetical protein